jgi:hypothetical protein
LSEIKITLIIIPESYDYGIEDIVYRIFVNHQLIIERSVPILEQNQAVADTFFLDNSLTKNYFIDIHNTKFKKIISNTVFINEKQFKIPAFIQNKDYNIKINIL